MWILIGMIYSVLFHVVFNVFLSGSIRQEHFMIAVPVAWLLGHVVPETFLLRRHWGGRRFWWAYSFIASLGIRSSIGGEGKVTFFLSAVIQILILATVAYFVMLRQQKERWTRTDESA